MTRRRGFSLIETLVAIVMIAVGVLALVSVSSAVTRQMTMGRTFSLATATGRARLERLQGVACGSLAAGSAGDNLVWERWSVATPPPGPNAAADVRILRDTVFFLDHGRTRAQAFVSMRSCP